MPLMTQLKNMFCIKVNHDIQQFNNVSRVRVNSYKDTAILIITFHTEKTINIIVSIKNAKA